MSSKNRDLQEKTTVDLYRPGAITEAEGKKSPKNHLIFHSVIISFILLIVYSAAYPCDMKPYGSTQSLCQVMEIPVLKN